ncbi:hypothetical protein BSLG_005158 [Batrachochytrium salamandrivorans]|nr:hypothetical protein BSLG_005158 [Batrachochytrium salamandrivorans]
MAFHLVTLSESGYHEYTCIHFVAKPYFSLFTAQEIANDIDKKYAPNFAFKESMLATLVEILKSQIYEVTTITLVKSDAEEEQVRQLLLDEAHGLVQLGLMHDVCYFCSTIQGGVYIVQHVCPDVHVDFRASSICDLATWVPQLVLVRQSQRGDHALGKVMVGTIADGSVLDDNIRKAYLPKNSPNRLTLVDLI